MTSYSQQFRKTFCQVSFGIAILIAWSITPITAAQVPPTMPNTSCRIEIGNAHISTFILESQGSRAVKVNATSICNITHSNVKLTVRIYKVGRFRNYLVAAYATNPLAPTSRGFRVKNQNAFMECRTHVESRFYGIAFAEAVLAGQKVAAPPTRSKRILPLHCGN